MSGSSIELYVAARARRLYTKEPPPDPPSNMSVVGRLDAGWEVLEDGLAYHPKAGRYMCEGCDQAVDKVVWVRPDYLCDECLAGEEDQ